MKYKKRNCTEFVNFHVVLTVLIVIGLTTSYLDYTFSDFHGRCCSVNRLPES